MSGPLVDAIGKCIDERFAEIRAYFLECYRLQGDARTELHYRAKPGDAREPTEEEIVRRWAGLVAISVADIQIGMQRAFMEYAGKGWRVPSFRECVPQIQERMAEKREGREA